jgi:WD40 repeat protein/serine/threonine protein kinase
MTQRIGQYIGNYRLLQALGKGGFAEVYLGEHRYLTTYAALKILHASLDEESSARFLAEAQTLGHLRHPHIVRVLEFSVERGMPVLVMDYAPGGTLRQLHPAGMRLDLQTVINYINQVSSALQYAHNHNIIHRDVKPENILLDTDENLLLSDFGISLLAPSPELLSTQAFAGTPPYTAPEQLRGKPAFASDQYALAIIAYEWLCGTRPFEGHGWEIIYKQLYDMPVLPRQLRPDLPAEVEDVLMRALTKDPAHRFASVLGFAHALARAGLQHDAASDEDNQITATLPKIKTSSSEIIAKHYIVHAKTTQKVFFCASPHDAAFTSRLKTDLSTRGVYIANMALDASADTTEQEERVQQEIRDSALVLVVLSPTTRSSHVVKEQMRIANMYERRMLFVWNEGNEAAQLLPVPEVWGKASVIKIIDARDTQYERALQKIIASLEQDSSPSLADIAGLDTVPGEPRNPYKGLHAFTGADARDFFGRDTLIQELAETLQTTLDFKNSASPGARLLAVIGPSGSGKSSVVMAGLLPALQQGVLPGSENWIYLEPIVPGTQPLEALALVLARHLPGNSLRSILHDLEDDSARGLHRLSRLLTRQAEQKVVLLIDQFEEVFTQAIEEKSRRRFIDLLTSAASEPQGSIMLILTLRADFYDRPMSYPGLGRLIDACHKSVLPMDLRDLRAVIERPAARPDVQLILESNLVGDLLFEAYRQAGALPLLEFTLDQLFQRREGRRLTEQAYRSIGGVKGALARHAEATYNALPGEKQRRLARALFLRLIDPGSSAQDTTRRRAPLNELSLPDVQQTELLRTVAEAFIAARLLTTSEGVDSIAIEVSHEALFREWKRLSGWLAEARQDIILQQTISADTVDWIKRGRPVDRLYRGSRLSEAQQWAERNLPSAEEAQFLKASALESERQQTEERQRYVREQKLRRQTVNRQRSLIVVLTLLLVVSVVFGMVWQTQSQKLNSDNVSLQEQIHNSNARALAAQANYALVKNQIDNAMLLSVKANTTEDTYDARDSLLTALEYSPRLKTILHANAVVNQLVLLRDNQTLISLDNAGGIAFWQPETGKGYTRYLDFHDLITIENWALSPDGQTVAGTGSFGLWLWNTKTGKVIAQLETASGTGASTYTEPLAFSPDGTMLASGLCTQFDTTGNCIASSILLWNTAAQKPNSQELIHNTFPVSQLAFTPDGQQLIASSSVAANQGGTDGSIQIWDMATRTLAIPAFANFTEAVQNFALSADGKTLAASDGKTKVAIWDMATQKALPLSLSVKGAQVLALSTDGSKLAIANTDNTIQLWNVSTGQPIDTPLVGHQGSISSLTFSPDGKMLVSSDINGSILVWDLTKESAIKRTFTYQNRLYSAIYSPDGHMIATGNDQGKIFLQDSVTGNLIGSFATTRGSAIASSTSDTAVDSPLAIESLAFSPDGHTLAAGRFDGVISLWSVATQKRIAQFGNVGHLKNILFHPEWHILAASYDNGTVQIWNIASGKVIHRFMHPTQNSDTASTIAFNRDGTILATGYNNGVIAWDSRTGKQVSLRFTQETGIIKNIAFSPDGRMFATQNSDSQIMLWNASTLQPILSQPLSNAIPDQISQENQTGLTFSSNGKLLVAGNHDAASLWEVDKQEGFAHPLQISGSGGIDHALVRGVAINPNDQEVLVFTDTYTSDYSVTLWNINIKGVWLAQACSIANRNFTMSEWRQFMGGDVISYQKVCPEAPVDSTKIDDELQLAHSDMQAGHTQDATEFYTRATHDAIELADTEESNKVCWDGATDQLANVVLPACKQAITLSPRYGRAYDSLGVALALSGHPQEAIANFTFYIQWATEEYVDPPSRIDITQQKQFKAFINEQTGWIQQLKTGKNPFTTKTLSAIRAE